MKKLIEVILSNVIWEIIKLTFESFIKATSGTISYIVWIAGFILLNAYLFYNYFIKKERYFAFPITGKILSLFHLNNPDNFIELNIEALKSHLFNWTNYESYKSIIKKVVLYRTTFETETPTLTKYILFFDLVYNRETESARKTLEDFIGKKLPIIGDEFKNVYKKETPNHHMDEWFLTAKRPEGIYEKQSYVLYS